MPIILDILPNELCQMIISYLSAQDRFSLAQTSQQMYAQVTDTDKVHYCSTRIIVVLSKMAQILLNKGEPPQLVEEQENIGCEQIVRQTERILQELGKGYPQAYKNQIEKPISIEQKTMGIFHEIVQRTSHSLNSPIQEVNAWLPTMHVLNVVEDGKSPGESNHQSVCNNLKKYQEILSSTDLRPCFLNDNIVSFYYLSQTYLQYFQNVNYSHVLFSFGLAFQLINYSFTDPYLSNRYDESCPFPDICDYMIDAQGTNLLLLYSFIDFLLRTGPSFNPRVLEKWVQRIKQKDSLLFHYVVHYFSRCKLSFSLPDSQIDRMQCFEQDTLEIVAQSLCNNDYIDQDKQQKFINIVTRCLSENTSPLDINGLAYNLPAKPILIGIIDQIKCHPFPYQVYKKNIPKLVYVLLKRNTADDTLLKDILYHKPPQYCLQLLSLVINKHSLRNHLTMQCTNIITMNLGIGTRWYQYIKYEIYSAAPFNCIQSGLLFQIFFSPDGQAEILNQLFETLCTSDKQRFFTYIQRMPMDIEQLVFDRRHSFFKTLVKYIKKGKIILSPEELNWMQGQGYIKKGLLHKCIQQTKQRFLCIRY